MTKAQLSTLTKMTVSSVKFEVEKFDGRNNFGMWQCEMLNIFYQQELKDALEAEKPKKIGR